MLESDQCHNLESCLLFLNMTALQSNALTVITWSRAQYGGSVCCSFTSVKMSLKCVGLVPLVLVFGVVLTFAQSVDHNCRDPILPDGYFLPLESEASAQAVITYACERGHKPAAQGWWATSRCQGNAWIPEPRCIDENACLPPTVPNSEQPKDPQRWYENGHVIWVTCEKGYEHKDRKTTAKCENGSWSTLPVCERDPDSCDAPPQVPHAIIVGHDYQKVYPSDSYVTYQCEDGFTSMQSDSATKVFCIAGSWSETPVCKRPVVDPEADGKVTEPEVRECGNPPSIENGYYVGQDKMTLTYECHAPYTLDGPNTVVCSNNGLWSELPTCKARSDCQIRPGRYHDGLEILQEILLNDRRGLMIRCYSNLYRIVRCDNGKITYTSCCDDWYFQHNYCQAHVTPY
ncbi:complement factor H-related protein 5-like isoform X6 [Cynoglossus semilaevis]|uniref:complement factor H-related protein 5-like isoform X6 n=1 Tax=Cynoglossus semilaevis TaxID=244447 RepID=UPI000495247F|nr:complement factor H-related protein 5-like isoform X6 [Cynoglossus semilaevis]